MGNMFTRAWRRLSAPGTDTSTEQQESEDPAVAINSCRDREMVTVDGTLSAVRTTVCQDTPSLQAELSDGSGALMLIWLGRREIPGIETGRRVRIAGRVSSREGKRIMYNPRYELTPGPQ